VSAAPLPDDNLFAVELVTPERVLVDGLATEVVLRTGEGDTTFLAGHAPLVGTVEPGVVRVVRAEGDEERVATHGGFVQVDQDRDGGEAGGDAVSRTRVTLLIGVAEVADQIDVARARAALESAEARVAELTGSGSRQAGAAEEEADPEFLEAEATRRRAEVRIEAADAGASTVPAGTAG
jgi:F-type H+-transporting ATPase subunit epsilon